MLNLVFIFSFTIGSLAQASQTVNFKPDPVVTVAFEEDASSWSTYIYGAIGVVVVYTIASLKIQPLRRFNRTLFGWLPRP